MTTLLKRKHALASSKKDVSVAYRAKVIADGAVNYWPLDDVSGTSARDAVGTRTGTITGTVLLNQVGIHGSKCMSFPADGTGKIGLPSLPNLGTAFTFEVWCNPSITGSLGLYNRQFISRVTQTDGDFDWGISTSTTNLRLHYFSTSHQNYNVPVILTAGVWSHYVVTAGAGQFIAYINGVAQTPQSAVLGGVGANVNPSIMGDTETGAENWGWRGLGQDLAIYLSVLTPAQISAHYSLR